MACPVMRVRFWDPVLGKKNKKKKTFDKQQSRLLSSFLSHRIYVFHGLRPGSVLFFCKLLICTELKSTLVELSWVEFRPETHDLNIGVDCVASGFTACAQVKRSNSEDFSSDCFAWTWKDREEHRGRRTTQIIKHHNSLWFIELTYYKLL